MDNGNNILNLLVEAIADAVAQKVLAQQISQQAPVERGYPNVPGWLRVKDICDKYQLGKSFVYNTIQKAVREGRMEVWGEGHTLRVKESEWEALGRKKSEPVDLSDIRVRRGRHKRAA